MLLLRKSPLIILIMATFLSYDSCKKDKQCDRTCFLGTWVANETCYNYGSFNIAITTSSTDANGIDMVGFGGFVSQDTVTASVFGTDLIIQDQTLSSNNITIVGSGTMSNDGETITVNYKANGFDCSGMWTK